MNIYISDLGIYKSDQTSYPITNTASVKKVDSLSRTDSSTDSVARQAQRSYVAENTPAYNISISSMGRAAIRSMQKFSAGIASIRENDTKASSFNASFGSLNDSARSANTVNTVNSFNTDPKGSNASSFDVTVGDDTTVQDTVPAAGSAEPVAAAPLSADEESETTSSVSSDLSRYTEYQLQQLLNEGSISRADYNNELAKRTGTAATQQADASADRQAVVDPVLRQAVEAYNYQMSYQINALITQ